MDTIELKELLTTVEPNVPMAWAQGGGRSNRPAPTIRKQLIYLERRASARLAHLWRHVAFLELLEASSSYNFDYTPLG